jgi:plastocyanin
VNLAAAIAAAGLCLVGCEGATAMPNAPLSGSEPVTAITVTLVARDIGYAPLTVSVPNGTPLVIALDNQDSGVAHGVVLFRDPSLTVTLAEGRVIVGPDRAQVGITPLIEGRYRIGCLVHPTMVADLIVTGG